MRERKGLRCWFRRHLPGISRMSLAFIDDHWGREGQWRWGEAAGEEVVSKAECVVTPG